MHTKNVGLGHRVRGDRTPQLVMIQPRPSLTFVLVMNLCRLLGRLIGWVARRPVATLAAVIFVAACILAGPGWPITLAALAGVGVLVWSRLARESFRRVVVSRWRWAAVYRRFWQPAMVTCGLAAVVGDREYLPRIRRVVVEPCADRVLVELLSGQAPEDFDARTSQLAHTFEAQRCRVRVDRPGRIWLDFSRADPLTDVVPAIEPDLSPDLQALPLGRREDGTPWRVGLLGSHVLIAGATGAGKGSVVWSLVRALGPAIRERSVELWAVDPKGGMELTPGASLFARFSYSDTAAMVDLLEDAVAYMRERAERLRVAGQRMHAPTTADPLVVVLVDEMAALTAYVGDRDLKKRADAALQLLLSQGRAAGVLVVAALQDPGKDVLPYRDLFPTRVALRLLEDTQVDMVLGRSARQHGAECDRIPGTLPGVGYVVLDGVREPVRVRAAYVTDADLDDMTQRWAPTAAGSSDQPILHAEPATLHAVKG